MATIRNLIITLLCLIAGQALAQDDIYLKSGEVLSAYDVQLGKNTITFKRADKPNREFEVGNEYVAKVVYRTGVAEYFGPKTDSIAQTAAPVPQQAPSQFAPSSPGAGNALPPPTAIPPAPPAQNAPSASVMGIPFSEYQLLSADTRSSDYLRGFKDGEANFQNYKAASITTTFTTIFLSPLYGLPVPIATSLSKPPIRNLSYIAPPDNANLNYVAGYRDGAAKKKSNRIWRNYGIVSGVYVGVAIIAIFSVISAFGQ